MLDLVFLLQHLQKCRLRVEDIDFSASHVGWECRPRTVLGTMEARLWQSQGTSKEGKDDQVSGRDHVHNLSRADNRGGVWLGAVLKSWDSQGMWP
jgi:hypothetical protein